MKITFLDTKTIGEDYLLDPLREFGELTLFKETLPDERLKNIGDSDIVISNKVVIDKAIMDRAPSMKLICIAATGMNNVDLKYASQKNIAVRNVEDYSTEAVAQHTFAALLELNIKNNYFDRFVKSGKYSRSRNFTHFNHPIFLLSGKRLGIIGLGNIGRRVAFIAKSFGMEIVFYSTSGRNTYPEYLRISLEELLSTSDVVSIHSPLNNATRHLIGKGELSLMKKNALILNMARGGIIDEVALAEAIDKEIIAGASTDVFEKEPIPEDHPFLMMKRKDHMLLTPHIAWSALEARKQLIEGISSNIREFLRKK